MPVDRGETRDPRGLGFRFPPAKSTGARTGERRGIPATAIISSP